jgi:hypothetical protein
MQTEELWAQPIESTEEPDGPLMLGGPDGPPEGPSGPPSSASKRPNRPGGMPNDAPTSVTRLMCATAYLQAPFADDVAGTLLDPEAKALTPSWGVDLVTLIRNTVKSRRRRIARDGRLGAVFVTAIVLILAVLAMIPLNSIDLITAGILVPLIVVIAYLIGLVLVFIHYDQVRTSVLDVMNPDLDPFEQGFELDEETEQRLADLGNANVVAYPTYNPFAGFGHALDSWTLTFDLEPGPGTGPVPNTVEDFTPMDVHKHLLSDVKDRTPDLWTGDILFALGATADKIKNPDGTPAIVPAQHKWTDWPASRVPQEVVERYVNKPEENNRTYAMFSRTGWRGEVVIFGLVRSDRIGNKVHIEGRTHALLPLRGTFRDNKFVASFSSRTFTQVIRPAARNAHWLLAGGLRRRMRRRYNIQWYIYEQKRLARHLNRGVPRNYGGGPSIREQAQAPEGMKYNATVDEIMYYRVLTRQIMYSLDDFLADHGADLSEFRRQANEIINRTEIMLSDADKREFGPQKTVRLSDRPAGLPQGGLGGPGNPGL